MTDPETETDGSVIFTNLNLQNPPDAWFHGHGHLQTATCHGILAQIQNSEPEDRNRWVSDLHGILP